MSTNSILQMKKQQKLEKEQEQEHFEALDISIEDLKTKNKEKKEQKIDGKTKSYIISSTLGKGTFGKVKMAYNIKDKNEKYACKILLKSNIKDEDDYIRCKREMKILTEMDHKNVVKTYEIISTDSTYYILMDYCAKGELFNYIVEQKHLNEEKSALFYYQLINGIDYIHKKGIAHRDLKPENLLLTNNYLLKIIDFGLSNFFYGKLLETPCGSPCYASPEMVMGKNYNGFCIDIWSSGIILYAMLCGYLPFEEGENDEYNEELFKNIVECNIEYPEELITPVAKDLLEKILVKNPEKRIKIDDIKKHNFYKLGELLFNQTYEKNINDINNVDENNKNNNSLSVNDNDNDNKNENVFMNINDLHSFVEESEKIEQQSSKMNEEDIRIDCEYKIDNCVNNNIKNIKNKEKNKNSNPADLGYESENKKVAVLENDCEIKNEKNRKEEKELIDKIYEIAMSAKNKKNKENNESVNSKKSNDKNKNNLMAETNISKKSKNKEKNKDICIESSLNLKTQQNCIENNKLPKQNSIHEDKANNTHSSNFYNINSNINSQYLRTENCANSSHNRYKNNKNTNNNQGKLFNKRHTNENKINFDVIIKSLLYNNKTKPINKNPYSKKKSQLFSQTYKSKSVNRKKYKSLSPGINIPLLSRKENNPFCENHNFPRQKNTHQTTHMPMSQNHRKNNYCMYNKNKSILNYIGKKFFYDKINKNIKPNKKFLQIKKNLKKEGGICSLTVINLHNIKNNNLCNTLAKNRRDYQKRISADIIKYKERDIFKKYFNKNCLSSNHSKDQRQIIDTKTLNDNFNSKNNNHYKKSFSNLKTPTLNNINENNSKPVLIQSRHNRTNTDVLCKGANNKYTSKNNMKNNSSKNKFNKNEVHGVFPRKIWQNDNQDNIIINFNILKPNIILDNQRTSSRKIKKANIFMSSNQHRNNINSPNIKVEHPITESNHANAKTVLFSKMNKGKNYKNFDVNKIQKNKEMGKLIKTLKQEMHKVQRNFGNSFAKKDMILGGNNNK